MRGRARGSEGGRQLGRHKHFVPLPVCQDALIVSASSLIFGDPITLQQSIAFILQLFFITLWSLMILGTVQTWPAEFFPAWPMSWARTLSGEGHQAFDPPQKATAFEFTFKL